MEHPHKVSGDTLQLYNFYTDFHAIFTVEFNASDMFFKELSHFLQFLYGGGRGY